MRCAECKHWKPRHGNWGKCVRLSKWQGSPLVIMDDRGNGVETENSFGCVCHEERTAKTVEENGSSHNKASAPCKWRCSCGQEVVGDYCKCGAYRCDL